MLSCAFFGHRDFPYWQYRDKIEDAIRYLIDIGVTEFYSGNRGAFDRLCASTAWNLKDEYPEIKNILVLSYYPDNKFKLPEWYDDAVYLLEKGVPPRYAISHTNRKLAQTVDYLIVGVAHKYGGAWSVYQYAQKHRYSTLNIITGEDNLFYKATLPSDMEKIVEEHKEETEAFYLRIKDQVEASIANNAKVKSKKKQQSPTPVVWVSVMPNKETTDC